MHQITSSSQIRRLALTASFTAAIAGCGGDGGTESATQTDALRPASAIVYADALGTGWSDWSWGAQVDLASTDPVASGSRAIAVTYSPWGGLYLHATRLSTANREWVELDVNGGATPSPALSVYATVGGAQGPRVDLRGYCEAGAIPAGAWTHCRIPLTDLGVSGNTLDGLVVQEFAGVSLPTLSIDSIQFGSGSSTAPAVSVAISPTAATVATGGTQAFTATVSNASDTSVAWSVQEGAAGGTITSTGVYTAPATAGTTHVVATSNADPSATAIAAVSVTAAGGGTVAGACEAAGVPADRCMDWNPGIAIPSRTTICATIDAATYGNGTTDAASAINAAIAACPVGQVVMLPAGTYLVNGTINLNRGITLRGAGPTRTRIRNASGSFRTILMAGYNDWLYDGGGTNLTQDAPRGSTTLTVASTADITAPGFIVIDQVDDPALVHRGDCSWSKRQTSTVNRSIGQVAEVVAINGNVLTLADPLNWTYTTALQAQVVPTRLVRNIGLEDLYVTGGTDSMILFNAARSWIKNVETDTVNVGVHIDVNGCYRCVVRDSYVHDALNYSAGGNAYGIQFSAHTANSLVENNIVRRHNKPVLLVASGGGNVIGYNYVDDQISGQQLSWQDSSIEGTHCSHPVMELIEGNWAPHIALTETHGSASHVTVFRNRATSQETSISQSANIVAMHVDAYMRDISVVGNVLGAPSVAQQWEASSSATCSPPAIYKIGSWTNDNQCDFGDYANVVASLFRHGNFDYYRNATQWDASTATRTLPPSMYLAAKPPFFGTNRWPWTGPDLSPMESTLPAKQRYDSGSPWVSP